MIQARDLGRRFGSKRVIRDLDLEVRAGELLLVTGPNGSGKSTLLALMAGLLAPTEGEIEVDLPRGRIGYLAHEALVYKELTALENLDLYGRLYHVAERRETIGALLERFGLWEARHQRVGSFSRGMQQRLALCRVLLHGPELLLLDEPYSGLDASARSLVDDVLVEARRREDARRRQPRARARAPARDAGARPRMTYFADVAALARKDILLELRSRDTLPAMLLFVVSALVVFHFSLPSDASATASTGLLWIALLFTALLGLGRAFTAEREQRVLDGLVLAPCDRSAIWLAKSLGVLVFLGVAEAVALPAYALFFEPVGWELVAAVLLADLGLAAVGTLLAAMAAASRARELLLPLLFLPLVIPVVVGGVGATVVDDPGRYLGFLALYDLIFAILSWASFEYVVAE